MPEREQPQPSRKKAATAAPVGKDWHPDHIQPVRTTFVSARHTTRMWKL